jgi:hypothetical protein
VAVAIAIVAGAIANKPLNGGESWVRLSWILGLRRLGFDVYFAEQLGAAACVDAAGRPAAFAESINRAHLEGVASRFGLSGRTSLLGERGERLYGLDAAQLGEAIAEAEVLFDVSGHLGAMSLAARARRRVYVDLDPGFTQAWNADPALAFALSGYDRYVTVGLNVGSAGCPVPVAGVEWITTLPPIVLDEWAGEQSGREAHEQPGPGTYEQRGGDTYVFTTVATWRSPYGPIEIGGRSLGLKHHEFRRLIELPERVDGARFELALNIDRADAADLRALRAHGWSVVSPWEVAGTADEFRDYVRRSCAEFSVAQPAYVQTRSGWFSDRTAAYLAAGRPALVQDTGVGGALELGEGLLTFSTPREAAEGARRILADPAAHAQAARRFAERHLDSDRVLGRLLQALGIGG